ncbi:uncharacterized protein LOC132407188 [Hypanus sabinus]|uniref:uncharacterized protein LOC132407188 n=1 Tax=Hypanus sabinus TaxID=79690 RepID=UPI0028C48997|nr:uncharacterized protein LOC132407188 [Hypanus sabinus]
MDAPAIHVSWPSPFPRHSRKNTPGRSDQEQNVIGSATKCSSALLRRPKHGVSTDRPSGVSQQMSRLQEKQRATEQCKVLKQIAQIVPHRVDRLYYIHGSHIPVQAKCKMDTVTFRRLQMRRTSQESVVGQEDHDGMSEENEPGRSCETTQAVESGSQDDSNEKYCPHLMLVFMTEPAEESPENLKGQMAHKTEVKDFVRKSKATTRQRPE